MEALSNNVKPQSRKKTNNFRNEKEIVVIYERRRQTNERMQRKPTIFVRRDND